jgi:F420 biosynthesis protein FbiB-like protein
MVCMSTPATQTSDAIGPAHAGRAPSGGRPDAGAGSAAPARPRSAIDRLILDRRSIRHFTSEPVPRSLVAELLEASLWSPSPHNSEPWRFTALFETRDKSHLAGAMADRLAAELRDDGLDSEAIERQTGRSRRRISTAPVVVLCSLVDEGLVRYGDPRRDELEWRMAVQSMGCVLQTLFLLAADRGIGSCWMAAPMYCPEVVRHCLGLPEEFQPQALALLGYPDTPGRERERRLLEEVIDLR